MVEKSSRVAAIYDMHANLPALEAILADLKSVDPDLIVCGHTHAQFDWHVGPKWVVNAGSVGMPC